MTLWHITYYINEHSLKSQIFADIGRELQAFNCNSLVFLLLVLNKFDFAQIMFSINIVRKYSLLTYLSYISFSAKISDLVIQHLLIASTALLNILWMSLGTRSMTQEKFWTLNQITIFPSPYAKCFCCPNLIPHRTLLSQPCTK